MSIILRDYTEKDFEAYSRLKMDAETMYYLQDIQLHPVEEARRDFAEVLSDHEIPGAEILFLSHGAERHARTGWQHRVYG